MSLQDRFTMSLEINSVKGKRIAEHPYNTYFTEGIFGTTEMSEDALPRGIKRGSLEHVLFITLTVSIDHQREAHSLCENSILRMLNCPSYHRHVISPLSHSENYHHDKFSTVRSFEASYFHAKTRYQG